jgi:hypothetical protein
VDSDATTSRRVEPSKSIRPQFRWAATTEDRVQTWPPREIDGAQPKRIPEVDRIALGEAVEIEPARQPYRIFLRGGTVSADSATCDRGRRWYPRSSADAASTPARGPGYDPLHLWRSPTPFLPEMRPVTLSKAEDEIAQPSRTARVSPGTVDSLIALVFPPPRHLQ